MSWPFSLLRPRVAPRDPVRTLRSSTKAQTYDEVAEHCLGMMRGERDKHRREALHEVALWCNTKAQSALADSRG